MNKLIHRREEQSYDPHPINTKTNKSTKALPPIQSLLKPKQQKRIVDKIFNKNTSEFEAFLNQLNSVSGWKEAFIKLDDEFSKRKIHSNGDEAVLLANIIYRHFYPYDDEVTIE